MSILDFVSIAVRVASAAWAVRTLVRVRDPWVAVVAVLCTLAAIRQMMDATAGVRSGPIQLTHGADEWLSLLISAIALVTVVFISRMYPAYLRSQVALRESEARYRGLFQNSRDTVFMTTADGIIQEVNPATVELLGYSVEELQAMKVTDAYANPALREAFQNTIARDGFVREYPLQLKRKDGSVVDCLVTASVARDETGAVLGYRGIIRDVTELNQALRDLHDSEERLRLIAEQTLAGIYMIRDGKMEFVNEAMARFIGLSQAELTGMPVEQVMRFIHPEDAVFATEQIRRKLSGDAGTAVEYEIRGIRVNGDERYVSLQSKQIQWRGQPALLGVMVDVTERKLAEAERQKLEEQVRHTQKLESLGVLAGGIAHDFNNLLVGILGNASFALEDLPADSPLYGCVEQIEEAAQRAAELVREMLAYSGKGRFRIEAIDLSSLTRQMASLLEASISKKARILYELEPNLPPIQADATQVRQIIMNLITNASEAFASRGGLIRLRTGLIDGSAPSVRGAYLGEELAASQCVFLEVTDDGMGMDADTLARIFDPFYTTKVAGRGLGLAAVLGIVRGHRGAIHVESQRGRGARFVVYFPAAGTREDIATTDNEPVQPGALEWSPGGGTILVVDDESVVRSLARRILERRGFDVMLATDGREAVHLFEGAHESIDAVILDLTMHQMSGREAYRRMRSIDPAIPILVCSGYNEDDVLSRFDMDGPVAFLHKPYRVAALMSKLESVLRAKTRSMTQAD